jgi:hypothetical protein
LLGTTVRRSSLPAVAVAAESIELAYETLDWQPAESGRITEALYEEYGLQTIRIPDSQAHPTKLVQSVAMASVAPPKPSYRPHLPPAVISGGLLSDAHLEAHSKSGDNRATNGLLLRSDLHRLLDRGLLSLDIAGKVLTVAVAPEVRTAEYRALDGRKDYAQVGSFRAAGQ